VLSAYVEGGSAACCLLRREGVGFARPTRYLGVLWRAMLAEREKRELKCQLNAVVPACGVAHKESAGVAA
jgi:hypothetical protein